jgi:hypothetical protein
LTDSFVQVTLANQIDTGGFLSWKVRSGDVMDYAGMGAGAGGAVLATVALASTGFPAIAVLFSGVALILMGLVMVRLKARNKPMR